MAARPFKRAGLHRLACEEGCGSGYCYATVANLESVGLPRCACGEPMLPERVELAMLLGLEDSWLVRCYGRVVDSVAKGQQPHIRRGRATRSPELVAAERMESERRESARKRRLAALRPAPEGMPF